jgi:integrase
MPASFKLILAPRADRDGLHDVRLRIIVERIVRYFNVAGVSVTPKQWNAAATTDKENWIKSNHHDYAELNDALFYLLRRAKKLSRDSPTLSADDFKRMLSTGEDLRPAPKAASPDFLQFCAESWARDDVGSFTQESNINKLATWWGWQQGQKPLTIELLTEQLVGDFETHLKRDLGNVAGTRRKNLGIIHLYVQRAIKRGLIPRYADPFEYYEMPTPAPQRVWLTDSEFAALESVVLPAILHLARTTYLLQYYLHGSRIGVVLRLKWKQRSHGAVRFKMDKGDREKLVEESPQLTSLLDSLLPPRGLPDPEAYILPWLLPRYEQMSEQKALAEMKRAIALVNRTLKRVAKKAGITTNLSSHSSRRTLADQADTATGDLGLVQGLLGHTARSTTEKYTQGRDTPAVHRGARQVYAQRPMPQVKPG